MNKNVFHNCFLILLFILINSNAALAQETPSGTLKPPNEISSAAQIITPISTPIPTIVSETFSTDPQNKIQPIITQDTLINFVSGFLAESCAGAIVGIIFYILIDRRIRLSQEKRAYRVVYTATCRAVQKLDLLANWLSTYERNNTLDGSAHRLKERVSLELMWLEKARNLEAIQQNLEPNFLFECDTAFSVADMPIKTFHGVAKFWDNKAIIGPKEVKLLQYLIGCGLDAILPVFRVSRKKLGIRTSEAELRKKLQSEMVVLDTRVSTLLKAFEDDISK